MIYNDSTWLPVGELLWNSFYLPQLHFTINPRQTHYGLQRLIFATLPHMFCHYNRMLRTGSQRDDDETLANLANISSKRIKVYLQYCKPTFIHVWKFSLSFYKPLSQIFLAANQLLLYGWNNKIGQNKAAGYRKVATSLSL